MGRASNWISMGILPAKKPDPRGGRLKCGYFDPASEGRRSAIAMGERRSCGPYGRYLCLFCRIGMVRGLQSLYFAFLPLKWRGNEAIRSFESARGSQNPDFAQIEPSMSASPGRDGTDPRRFRSGPVLSPNSLMPRPGKRSPKADDPAVPHETGRTLPTVDDLTVPHGREPGL